ncbi:MAG: 4a-hydroxytetrahydrobiopterin dehydratase [Gammaproteobacteria bacterium]
MAKLVDQYCSSDPDKAPRLREAECEKWMSSLNQNWQLDLAQQEISRTFEFKNYYQTTAFANSVFWIAHQQNHHPDLTISYKYCAITYTTHSVKGLSINDFICAARIDVLLKEA